MSGKREDILASAVKFLQDPKVQSSPLGKKVAFLESKGMTSEEIEEAMQRANGTAATTTTAAPYGPGGQVMMAPPPLPPKYDWKDMFIAAVVAGGFSYGLWQVAKKVVGPKLQWPSQEDLELDKKKLDEQFEEIEKNLTEVKESTTVVAKNVEDQTAHVKESLENMSGVLDGMKTNDEKREQELSGLKSDIENIKSMIPKLMDKNKESQANVLNELQTEIKSLKSLLLNRRAPGASPAVPGSPVASAGAPGAPWSTTYGNPSSTSQPSTPSTKGPEEASGAMNFLNSKASIPAWQLAAQKSTVPATSSTAEASNSSSAAVEGSETTTSA
ncbi:peroxisomal membrane anchor protein conserved region-domain-containing protein [Lobosporangium transversale]|uniref:Peroxisomal membrane protein PEX14 n=1 Tax=Lobosporangium transversale TaxID=64571 RepID=A0A1Y2GZG0_9FUNG|nr:peroxisomal membrane anchor protein conserved region-domain-containing protein [Lobosporangium transversale]ORZ27665.1 peroxisomal membrane anchor protein conserved region-domain-containing protein [Lobosporangium transversale]|eukprot:XP_021885368.1 peroxisomal membrane anchor protein conserved region-domain-containing protein [Lobosporangium transversale]